MGERKLMPMSRADEYREIAKDCVAMGRPDLAIGFQTLAAQAEREEDAIPEMFGFVRGSGHD